MNPFYCMDLNLFVRWVHDFADRIEIVNPYVVLFHAEVGDRLWVYQSEVAGFCAMGLLS